MLKGALEPTINAAKSNGIKFVYGLAPGDANRWNTSSLFSRIEYIVQAGGEVSLLFDDSYNCKSDKQMVKQSKLANEVNNRYGLFGICHRSYSGDLQSKIKPLYSNLNKNIPIIHVGLRGWNRSMDHKHVFYFNGQPNIVWDNWIAVDSAEPRRLKFIPPKKRIPKFIKNIEGYLLNLCFPEERIVHMIASLSDFKNRDRKKTVEIMSKA